MKETFSDTFNPTSSRPLSNLIQVAFSISPFARDVSRLTPERRLALIHRVLVPDKDYPKEYAILITDTRSIFIRQGKTRCSFVLRGEIRFGTALVTDTKPKTLDDYEQTSLESLASDTRNITVPHEAVISLALKIEERRLRKRDFFVWLTMKRQGHKFQVYDFEMTYHNSPSSQTVLKFYMVPLGMYFKPRRQTETRQSNSQRLRDGRARHFQKVLPAKIFSS